MMLLPGAFRWPVPALPGLILLLAGVAASTGCGSEADATSGETDPGVPVRTAPVVTEARPLPLRAGGRLAAKSEVDLSFKVGGVIDRIFVDEGAAVRKGQVLARLHLAEIDAQVLQAQSGVDKAARDLARVERLHRDSVATLEQRQDARTALEIAQAQAEIAAFNRRYAVIEAPEAGRILRRAAEEGELVQPGRAALTLGAVRSGWVVRVGLADRDVVALHLGDTSTVAFDAYPGRRFYAVVSEIAEAADPRSGTFEVELAVRDPDGLLKSGFIATADLYPSTRATYRYVPIEALVEGDGQEGVVFAPVGTDGRVEKRRIRIARLLDDEVAVAAGLDGVTEVVTDGAAYLDDGARVRVIPPR